jgi:hypothetical protein
MRHRILFLLCFFFVLGSLTAQKLSLGYIYPAGGEKESTVDIEIGGLNLTNATGVLISGDGVKAEIILPDKTAEKNKKKKPKGKSDDQISPQLADIINVHITINKSATTGLRDLRLQSVSGISNKLSFEVGQYPNVLEQKGSTAMKPNFVSKLPATLCGQIMPGEVDYFSFKVTKGVNLVASVKGRTLVPYIADAVPGWFQPVIKLTNSKGQEIAYNDDYRNAVDPVIIIKIPETDTYMLAIHDAIYRGREDFNYRIDVGEIPYLSFAYPCVGNIGKNTTMTLKGVNLNSNKIIYKPTKPGYDEFTAPGAKGYISNPIPFFSLEKKAGLNLSSSKKMELGPRTSLFDSIISPYQIKKYKIHAEKNENIAVEIIARRLASMLDAKMTLRDENGKILLVSDDVEDPTQGLMTFHADPVINYKAKEAGNYTVEVEDVLGNYGSDYYYLIQRKNNIPSYEVFVSPANLTIPRGGTAVLRLDVTTNEKFVPALEVSFKGLPKSFVVSSLQTQVGNKVWDISITAPQNAKQEKLSLEVLTQAHINRKEELTDKQTAVAADNMMQAFYYTHHIPAAGFVADVVPAALYSIHLSKEIESDLSKSLHVSLTDTVIPLEINIVRAEGFIEPIELNLSKKIKQITMEPITVQPNETEKIVYLKINQVILNKMKKVRFGFNIVGTVKGVIDQKGKRSFQNAKYREQTPIFILEKNE